MTKTQESALASLRERIKDYIGGKRLSHTYGVEREIAKLAAIYDPDEQIRLCDSYGISYTSGDRLMPKTFHAQTACETVRRRFPEFFNETVYSAILYHTTGQADMSIGEKLLYLADYIEDTRTFPDCVELRKYFWDRINAGDDRQVVLRDTLIISFDMTIKGLIGDGTPIHRDTVEARNFLIEEREFEK